MASPTGGDYDFDPPQVIRSNPAFNATNVTTNKIQIYFDELVQVERPAEKVIVTPPQKRLPKIQAISNRVIVEFRDTLLPNTTYTIDFTDAIADNNEKNPLENFSFSFSTGDIVDSLSISGKVLSADNLEPVQSIYVGLHSDLNDSAFITKPFDRISRTNDKGEFTIRGVAEGEYRLFALDDKNRSFIYQNPTDAIAFMDSLIVPVHTRAIRQDTIYNNDLSVDTIIDVHYTQFLPDNIVLRTFVAEYGRQFLQKYERLSVNELMLYFGAPEPQATVKPLNFVPDGDWFVLERSQKNDTLKYWITDPLIMEIDTLKLEVTYFMRDSLDNLVPAIDSLNFVDRNRARQRRNDSKNDKKDENISFLGLTTNLRGGMDVTAPVNIKFDQPVRDFDANLFTLQHLVDSVYVDEIINIVSDSLNPTQYSFRYKWEPGETYRLIADSAAFTSYTGLWNNTLSTVFNIRKLEEYGNLYIELNGLNQNTPAFVELLNESDKPLRKSFVRNGSVLFMNLNPGIYYARLIVDANNNGKWDTGDYYNNIQPEEVYYCNRYFQVNENWNHEEAWDIGTLPIDRQKPLEITKNKPQEKDSKRRQLQQQEQESRRQQQNAAASGIQEQY